MQRSNMEPPASENVAGAANAKSNPRAEARAKAKAAARAKVDSKVRSVSDKDKQLMMKEVHRCVKKAKNFLIQRSLRKQKTLAADQEKIDRITKDVELFKGLSMDALVQRAWARYMDPDQKKLPFPAEASAREKELSGLVVTSTVVKKGFDELQNKRKKKFTILSKLKQEATAKKNKKEKQQKKQEDKDDKEDGDTTKDEDKANGVEGAESDSETKKSAGKSEPESKKKQKTQQPSGKLRKLELGAVVDGIVDGVEDFGVFIDFFHKKNQFRGLCHVSEIMDQHVKPHEWFKIGDPVRAVVIKLDYETQKASLGMKKCHWPEEVTPWVPTKQKAKQKAKQKEKESDEHTGESVFISTLRQSDGKDDGIAQLKKEKEHKLKLMAMAKGMGNKHLGQRARRKLIEEIYQDSAQKLVQDLPKKPKKLQKTKKREAEDVEVQDGEEGQGGPKKKPKKAQQVKQEWAGYEAQEEQEEHLHPSWIAKKKQQAQAAATFQGKKVRLDD